MDVKFGYEDNLIIFIKWRTMMNGSTLKKVNNIREIFKSPFSCLSWTSTYVNKTDVVLKSFLELSNFLCFHSPLFNNFPAVICTWNLQ